MVAATFALVISWEEELSLTQSPSIPRLWKETQ